MLPQLRHRWQLWLTSDPWPGSSTCHGVAKKRKKKKRFSRNNEIFLRYYRNHFYSRFLFFWPGIGLRILCMLGFMLFRLYTLDVIYLHLLSSKSFLRRGQKLRHLVALHLSMYSCIPFASLSLVFYLFSHQQFCFIVYISCK